ncbi:cell division protein FtsA [Listeria newyorkensis]|uniref:Cell division protein FtsA n=1 Tax=Listeria newyorkensis TaxID=1497681 RepID=A0ABX4XN95_9LIST|nr:cell division protein FtsA [Listeria newyorkensis]KGL41118.1 cell division protein FtsA [Listeria newyorkensis]PNP91119.1 cell division protein FtsA [Listeria newyorkensis]WAO21541.1 cell division protein FtsA [Listeria newyorkensis]SQC58874.1 Cell division protein FtsA [Listeria newyorkensis]
MGENEIYVSLDIGTSSVKVIIAEMANDRLNIIGVGNVASQGVKKGVIVDIDKTVESIKKAIEQAERMVGVHVSQVIVGIVSSQVRLEACRGVVAISGENREITDDDVWNVIDSAQVISLAPDREIINVIPDQYVVDGFEGVNPRGMIGVRLEMEGTLITGSKAILHNTLRCVERAGLEITDIVLQPLAEGSVSLTEDDKEFGTALINIGAGTTTISVFEQGKLTYTTVLPVGGEHVTKDLSLGLNTSTANAEKVKLEHGYAFYDDASEDIAFGIDVIGSDQQQHFTQLEVADIIEARMEEIYTLALEELARVGKAHLPGGYVLTGGVMSIPGAIDLAGKVFQAHVRLAIPDYIGVREPSFTTAVGLIKYAYQMAEKEGRSLNSEPSEAVEVKEEQYSKPKQKPKKTEEEKVSTKMKNFFGAFFD